MPHIHRFIFGKPDLAAATVFTAMPIMALPDVTDVASIPLPKPMRLIGVTLAVANASTDTIEIQATKNGATAVLGPTLLNSAALGTQQNVYVGFADSQPFNYGDKVGMAYKTTTAGTYTAVDVYAEAVFEDFDD